MKAYLLLLILIVVFLLAACQSPATPGATVSSLSTQAILLTNTPLMASTSTPLPTSMPTDLPTSTPQLTSTSTPESLLTPTPIPVWRIFEIALAEAILGPDTYPSRVFGNGLCEWEIYGRTRTRVYLYAVCQDASSAEGTTGGVPAVVVFNENQSIEKVLLPRDGADNLPSMEALFPPEILPKVTQGRQAFTFSFEAALKHIALRRDHPGMPPKIVEEGVDLLPTGMSATPLPSSTSTPLPTFTPTPAPDLLTCQDRSQPTEAPQPARLIYTDGNDVWQWEETGGKKMQIPLPDGATAPLVSDDGQWIAFLKQGQAYDTPDSPVASIPLFLLNRQSGQVHRVASFETTETRQLYSLSPYISLDMHWLPGGHFLLVQIYPRPWGEGTLQPTGDLYLLDADTSSPQLLLKGGEYAYYSFRPDGKGIAALSTAGMQAGETFDYNRIQEGTLHLMSVPLDSGIRDLELRLTENPWTISAPKYSPDGYHIVLQVETGLAVVDIGREQVLQIPIVNPCATAGCYWGGPFVISWFPDGQSFYTLTSINDHFDTRAETTLHLIRLEPDLTVETAQIIHAAPWTFSFSPDLRILSYWNQPDLDTPGADLNRVTLYLMDLQSGQSKRYQAQYELRVTGWSPDNQRFLYLYSPVGGPNLVTDHLALGSICQPPQGLPVPEGMLIDHVRWLDPARFLAWTTPASGIPDHYTTGLYLYSLAGEGQPVHIDNQAMDMLAPYGMQAQVLVVEQ